MSKTRNVYLKMKTLQEATENVTAEFSVEEALVAEEVPVPQAVGRVLAEPIYAKTSAPHFNAAAMDGLAVKAQSTFGASEATTTTSSICEYRPCDAAGNRCGDYDRTCQCYR